MASVQVVALTKSFGDTHILKGITLDGNAANWAALPAHLTLTHTREHASAVVVLEKRL